MEKIKPLKDKPLESYWISVCTKDKFNYYKCGNCFSLCAFPRKFCPTCGAENKLVSIVGEVK